MVAFADAEARVGFYACPFEFHIVKSDDVYELLALAELGTLIDEYAVR